VSIVPDFTGLGVIKNIATSDISQSIKTIMGCTTGICFLVEVGTTSELILIPGAPAKDTSA
jgi:hypothetical protein